MGIRRDGSALGRLASACFLLGAVAACQKSATEPGLEFGAVSGVYTMTVLRFDPDGSLPENNLLPATANAAQLNLTASGQAQIVWVNPATSLVVTVPGTFGTTANGVRVQFASDSPYAQLLLSKEMTFTYSADTGVLAFDGPAPDGVSRTRLLELEPSLAGEQLLDPTPGRLRVSFARD